MRPPVLGVALKKAPKMPGFFALNFGLNLVFFLTEKFARKCTKLYTFAGPAIGDFRAMKGARRRPKTGPPSRPGTHSSFARDLEATSFLRREREQVVAGPHDVATCLII